MLSKYFPCVDTHTDTQTDSTPLDKVRFFQKPDLKYICRRYKRQHTIYGLVRYCSEPNPVNYYCCSQFISCPDYTDVYDIGHRPRYKCLTPKQIPSMFLNSFHSYIISWFTVVKACIARLGIYVVICLW